MTAYILIPAYNEDKTIGYVIANLRQHGWKNILVVDDGSTDATASVAKLQRAEVIQLTHNSGQGKALQIGIEHLKSNQNPDVIVTFDADGQHRAHDVKGLIEAIAWYKVDVALGSRFLSLESQTPFLRKYLLNLAVIYTRWTTGLNITDTHNGLRALTRKAYRTINLTLPRRAHASQILYQIARAKLRYCEVPVTILYPSRGSFKSRSPTVGAKA